MTRNSVQAWKEGLVRRQICMSIILILEHFIFSTLARTLNGFPFVRSSSCGSLSGTLNVEIKPRQVLSLSKLHNYTTTFTDNSTIS